MKSAPPVKRMPDQRGQSTVELVVGVAIILGTLITALLTLMEHSAPH